MMRIAIKKLPDSVERERLTTILDALGVKCKWSHERGFERYDTGELWNPLTDDGDALRLAVRLGILSSVVRKLEDGVSLGCRYENTRRVIVDTAFDVVERHAQAKSLDTRKTQQ